LHDDKKGETMAIDERERHELHQRLEAALGADEAATLMAYLPPAGWSDVATKHDLFELEGRVSGRVESLEHRLTSTLHRELQHQQRFLITVMLAWGSALMAVALAIGKAT
jgi:hypothetical protein